jgi:hypothetical protein
VEVTRVRFGSVLEWLVAAACILAVVAGAALLLGDVQSIRAVTPVIAGSVSQPQPPANLPPRAVSVPLLVLGPGSEIHVGERAAGIADKLWSWWESGPASLERGAYGERVTRFYDDGQRKFTVVSEPRAAGQEPQVTAIYLY